MFEEGGVAELRACGIGIAHCFVETVDGEIFIVGRVSFHDFENAQGDCAARGDAR